MSMFSELYELAQQGPVTLGITAGPDDGRMVVTVATKAKQSDKMPALATPLSLTAMPADFDMHFTVLLQRHRTRYASLVEQAEVTEKALEAAKASASRKAAGAANASPPARPATSPTTAAATAAAPASEPAPDGAAPDDREPDLFGGL